MKKYVIMIFTVIYLSSYIEVRRSHLLVHSSSFTSNHEGIKLTHSHKISSTDVIGLLQPRLFYASFFTQLIYTPLTIIEEMYWYVVEPKDKLWPYTLKTI